MKLVKIALKRVQIENACLMQSQQTLEKDMSLKNSLYDAANRSMSPSNSNVFLTKVDSKEDDLYSLRQHSEIKQSNKTIDFSRQQNKSTVVSLYRQGTIPTDNSKF